MEKTKPANEGEPTWEDIGNTIGKKIEKESKGYNRKQWKAKEKIHVHGSGGVFYFLGFIGSAIYFISNTSGFWMIVLSILKAMVWPAFIV